MTQNGFYQYQKALIKEINKLNPQNCEFCGGFHSIRVSRVGTSPIFENFCCDEMVIRVNEIERRLVKEYENL